MDREVAIKIDDFFGQYRTRKYSKGQVLILNEDEAQYVYQLVSGSVKQYDVTYRGDELILNIYKAPSFFPMSLALNKTPNPYIYEAATDIEVRQAPADEAVQFLKDNPNVTFDLLKRVYRGIDGLLGRVAQLMSGSVKSRLMYEIVIECSRFGECDKNGNCTIRLNESDLASRAGLSRETVSREIHKLSEEKLLKLANGKIIIFDFEGFQSKSNKAI